MNDELDQILIRLRDAPLDRGLDGIERRVWARIEGDRLEVTRSGAWGWRAALAAVMLCVGAFAGSMEATRDREHSPFAIHSTLAPTTLLEDAR